MLRFFKAFFPAALLAPLLCLAADPAGAAAAYDQPFPSVTTISCSSDSTCSLLSNVRVKSVVYNTLQGTAWYGWATSCPGAPDGVFYVRPTGASAGCFAMQGFSTNTVPGVANLTTGNFAAGVIDPDPTLAANSNSRVATQAAAKAYTDNAAQGLVYKTPVQLATTASITLSGEQTVDGVLTSSSFVLVNNQADATQNGIYVSGAGSWTRRTDANTGALLKNAAVLVTVGATNINTTWNCPCAAVTIGSSSVVFVKISGSNVYTPGSGLQLSGNQFSVDGTVNRNNASTLSAGTVPAARGGAGTVSGALAGDGSGNVSRSACSGLSDAGGACSKSVGTTTGTVAAGDDPRLNGNAKLAGNNAFTGNNTHDAAGSDVFNGPTSFVGSVLQAQDIPWQRFNPTVAPPSEFPVSCGWSVSSEANGLNPLIVALPLAPPPGCLVFLYASGSVNPIWVDPNPGGGTGGNSGAYIKTNDFDRVATLFTLPGSKGHAGFFLRYVSNGIGWQFNDGIAPPSSLYRYNLHNGAVRFDHDPTLAQTRLCPQGDGGLIILRKLTYVAHTCVLMPDATVGSASTHYYVYAIRQVQVPIVATEPGGTGSHCPALTTGAVCMTLLNFGDAAFFQSGDPITCPNFGLNPLGASLPVGTAGVSAPSAVDDQHTMVFKTIGTPNVTYIGLSDVPYVAPEAAASYSGGTPPQCAFTVLKPDSAPVLDPLTEIRVNQSRPFETLVGAVYVDAGGNVVSSGCEQNVWSEYNRQPRQLQCNLAVSTSTSATQYRTFGTFQAQFIVPATPNSGGNVGVPWDASLRGQVPIATFTAGVDAIFDQSSRAANSICTSGATLEFPDDHVVSVAQTIGASFQNVDVDLKTHGITAAAVEGSENYMHPCAFVSANTMSIKGTDEAGLVGPGATSLSLALQQ